MDANDKKILYKQEEKDIVSSSVVEMPKTFLKPLDYSTDLLLKIHPTLREYKKLQGHSETDPEYHL